MTINITWKQIAYPWAWREQGRRFLGMRFHILSMLLGFTIPTNVFGPGLNIAHRGTIVVNGFTKVGANCRIHACVNIGTKAGYRDVAPTIGDNVYIGPGVKIFGDVKIANGVAIGANAVVNKSFEEEHVTIAGVPAKKLVIKGQKV
jgi:serine O-acetyltransferase